MTLNENLICQSSAVSSMLNYVFKQGKEKSILLKAEKFNFSGKDKDRIIQISWEDRTPFEAIEFQFGLKEKYIIEFMRKNSLPSSFRMWRKRMKARKTKHTSFRDLDVKRFKCDRQRGTGNKISKR